MKVVVVNGSPRREKNTGSLLKKMVEGAESKGASAELIHLRDLKYSGCISCFHCKRVGGKYYGRCVVKDDLTPILQKTHDADVLIFGTPFYFSIETSLMRAFLERLWFQYFIYSTKKPPLSPRKHATALVYTMNVPEEAMSSFGKDAIVAMAKLTMEKLFAPCEIFLSCNTKQFDDYSLYEIDYFDVPAKLKRHEEIFPLELEKAFALGARLVS